MRPCCPNCLTRTPEDQDIGPVTANGACDTRTCLDVNAKRGDHAVMQPRRNVKPRKPTNAGTLARNEAVHRVERNPLMVREQTTARSEYTA
ncbi:MAG: hypothetical protein ACJAQW_000438 [Paracoccaceae bacterium]|jgi:hypothetical protein